MKVIGLTGGIASGKSTVSRFLAGLGATVIDVDRLWHEGLKADSGLRQEVVAAFGEGVLTADGNVDRQKLGAIVFNDAEALARLNGIMEPWMYRAVRARLDDYRRRGVKVVVLEAALLLEAEWVPPVDEVWVTTASEATVLQRLKERSGLSPAQALARLRSQMPDEERLKQADVVISNDGSLDELKAKVEELWGETGI